MLKRQTYPKQIKSLTTQKDGYCATGIIWYCGKPGGMFHFYTENLTFPYIAEQLKADEVYNNMVTDLEEVLDSKILPMKRELTWAGRMTQQPLP